MRFSSDVHSPSDFDLLWLWQQRLNFKHCISSVHVFISNSLTWCSHKSSHFSYCCFCSGHKSNDSFVVSLVIFLIFVKLFVFELRSMVNSLTRPQWNIFCLRFFQLIPWIRPKLAEIFLWWCPPDRRWSPLAPSYFPILL